MHKNIYAGDIPKNIAASLNGQYDIIPLPAILQSSTAKNAVAKDKSVNEVLSNAKKSNIAIFTAGAFQKDNAFVEGGYFSKDDFEHLKNAGAIGDICSHVINENGDICDMQLERRTVAISLDDIIAIPTKICIAAGKYKINSILAAVKMGCVNVLISTEETAKALSKR